MSTKAGLMVFPFNTNSLNPLGVVILEEALVAISIITPSSISKSQTFPLKLELLSQIYT
jgi:hypothetical protein